MVSALRSQCLPKASQDAPCSQHAQPYQPAPSQHAVRQYICYSPLHHPHRPQWSIQAALQHALQRAHLHVLQYVVSQNLPPQPLRKSQLLQLKVKNQHQKRKSHSYFMMERLFMTTRLSTKSVIVSNDNYWEL